MSDAIVIIALRVYLIALHVTFLKDTSIKWDQKWYLTNYYIVPT